MPDQTTVEAFAPYLRFEDPEKHFPGKPETFRRESRFRQSNYKGSKDRGWNNETNQWEDGNRHGPNYLATPWKTILDAIHAEAVGDRPAGPTREGPVTRPRDDRNLWEKGKAKGFFLELREGYAHDSSGDPNQPVPIFYEVERFQSDSGDDWVALYYWFFYIYNWN